MAIRILLFIWQRPWLLIIVAFAMFFLATRGLSSNIRIRNAVAQGNIIEETITDKTIVQGRRRRRGGNLPDHYYIAWRNIDVEEVGGGRRAIAAEAWYNLQIGDTIRFVQLDGSDRLHIIGQAGWQNRDRGWGIFFIIFGAFLIFIALFRILGAPKKKPDFPHQKRRA